MSLCLLASGKLTVMAVTAFSLSWTHSVEKVRWQEDWRVTPAGLVLVEARVKGSAAGMEPPEEAVLKDGWWAYRPHVGPQARVLLARSGATGDGWKLCSAEGCTVLGTEAGEAMELSACRP